MSGISLSQFLGLRANASNLVSPNTTEYTAEMFSEAFPQFTKKVEVLPPTDPPTYTSESLIPQMMLDSFISMANAAIQENRWFEKWSYAMGLFVAHYATLYLRTYAENSPNAAAAANTGSVLGVVASASLGDASVSYDTKAVTAATELWGAWNGTTYGQLLVTEARLVAMGGTYVI
ncbi:MAG: DUF4054 domain-containing protein [Oscillospiraceae bacterium]|jgi:hypothetical protein|nr:DUF4054 domain-containing protein [Oscillospiraceae bacterium]